MWLQLSKLHILKEAGKYRHEESSAVLSGVWSSIVNFTRANRSEC